MTASAPSTGLTVGYIGLGDQGLPMAKAVADAGFALHTWTRRAASDEALGDTPHERHESPEEMAAASDVVCLCVSTDDDVLKLVDPLLEGMRPGSVLVNHGTGLPAVAVRLAQRCEDSGMGSLDAPVSGGRPAAEERRLTTLVGGPQETLDRCEPVFDAFSRHVVHLGPTGAGQSAKLLNNMLVAMNHASIAEIVGVAAGMAVSPARLVEVFALTTASSTALTLLNSMIRPDNVEHLAAVQKIDIELFQHAVDDAGVDGRVVAERSLTGVDAMADLLATING